MKKKTLYYNNLVLTFIFAIIMIVTIISVMVCRLASLGYTLQFIVAEKKIEVSLTNSNL